MNISIRKIEVTEVDKFVKLILLFEEVFQMNYFAIPPLDYLSDLLKKDEFYAFAAYDEKDELVGGLTAYKLMQYYSTKPLVYIFDLAVKEPLQRNGIGSQLVATINSYCKKMGAEEVFVQADRVDDYALNFYRKTGGTEEDVVHFTYALNSPSSPS